MRYWLRLIEYVTWSIEIEQADVKYQDVPLSISYSLLYELIAHLF